MKVLIIGATGRVGKLLVEYALEAGHQVVAFARDISQIKLEDPALSTVQGDVLYPALIEAAVDEVDAVMSVIGIRKFRGPITTLSTGTRHIVDVLERKGPKRFLTLTGAGILQENPDYLIMESLSFPPNLQNLSMDHLRMYQALRNADLDWTIVAPAFMHSGTRTGNYLLREDYFPQQAQNQISVEDVADFMVREVEENRFIQKRVGIAHPY